MTDSQQGDRQFRFSLVEGGLFHRLLGRLGLLAADGLPTWRTAVLLALVAWLPPAIFDLAQMLVQDDYPGWGYFRDPTVYTRYLVAIIAMVITERIADERLSLLIRQFPESQLLAPESHEKFKRIVSRADQLASRPVVEVLLVLVALVWSGLSFYFVSLISDSGWEEWGAQEQVQLSWAGTAGALLSNPIFLFLVLRWLWRFLVWTWLLYEVSRQPLRLVPAHPDRAGGLGFLALFPGIFVGFIFALSCVVSASLLKTTALMETGHAFIWLGIIFWVILMALLFLAPLLVFSMPMIKVREWAQLEYGKLAQAHHRAFQDKWINGELDQGALLGEADTSSGAEINTMVETALSMRMVPLNLVAVAQVLIAALLPFIAVVLSQIPMTQILQWLMGAIF